MAGTENFRGHSTITLHRKKLMLSPSVGTLNVVTKLPRPKVAEEQAFSVPLCELRMTEAEQPDGGRAAGHAAAAGAVCRVAVTLPGEDEGNNHLTVFRTGITIVCHVYLSSEV